MHKLSTFQGQFRVDRSHKNHKMVNFVFIGSIFIHPNFAKAKLIITIISNRLCNYRHIWYIPNINATCNLGGIMVRKLKLHSRDTGSNPGRFLFFSNQKCLTLVFNLNFWNDLDPWPSRSCYEFTPRHQVHTLGFILWCL